MLDGTDTIASEEPAETPASPEVETTPAAEPVNLEAPAEGAEPEAPAEPVDELDEIEFDGERYKIPKKLKNGFLMQSDYTRKTQEVAAERKAIEAAKEAAKQEAEASRAHVREIGMVHVLSEQLAEYDKLDWNALQQSDPFEAQRHFQQRILLKDKRDALIAQIQEKEQKRSQESQQEFAKRYADTNEALARDIKGWNQDLATKLRDFATANGATEDDIRTLAVNAPLVKLLHKAWLGEQLVTAKQTQARTVEPPKPPPQPLTKVTGSGARPVAKPEQAADMDTYVALRKKQGFGKR
jgi:hypothetical protein